MGSITALKGREKRSAANTIMYIVFAVFLFLEVMLAYSADAKQKPKFMLKQLSLYDIKLKPISPKNMNRVQNKRFFMDTVWKSYSKDWQTGFFIRKHIFEKTIVPKTFSLENFENDVTSLITITTDVYYHPGRKLILPGDEALSLAKVSGTTENLFQYVENSSYREDYSEKQLVDHFFKTLEEFNRAIDILVDLELSTLPEKNRNIIENQAKIKLLSALGAGLLSNYDDSRAGSLKPDGVSEGALIRALGTGDSAGVCRDIAVLMAQAAEKLEFDSPHVMATTMPKQKTNAYHAMPAFYDRASGNYVVMNYDTDMQIPMKGDDIRYALTELENQFLGHKQLFKAMYTPKGKPIGMLSSYNSEVYLAIMDYEAIPEAAEDEMYRYFFKKDHNTGTISLESERTSWWDFSKVKIHVTDDLTIGIVRFSNPISKKQNYTPAGISLAYNLRLNEVFSIKTSGFFSMEKTPVVGEYKGGDFATRLLLNLMLRAEKNLISIREGKKSLVINFSTFISALFSFMFMPRDKVAEFGNRSDPEVMAKLKVVYSPDQNSFFFFNVMKASYFDYKDLRNQHPVVSPAVTGLTLDYLFLGTGIYRQLGLKERIMMEMFFLSTPFGKKIGFSTIYGHKSWEIGLKLKRMKSAKGLEIFMPKGHEGILSFDVKNIKFGRKLNALMHFDIGGKRTKLYKNKASSFSGNFYILLSH